MTTAIDTRLIQNPAIRLIRSTDDEIIVRFGSRGRASRRISDSSRKGILADLVFAFEDGAKVALPVLVCGLFYIMAWILVWKPAVWRRLRVM